MGGTLHTIVQPPIAGGVLLIRNGRIEAVGAEIAVPVDAKQIDVSGKHIYPGLIDAETSLGLIEIEAVRATRDTAEVGQINPNAQAIVAFNPDSELIPVAKADGILIAHSVPRGGLISGQSAVVVLDGWNAGDIGALALGGHASQLAALALRLAAGFLRNRPKSKWRRQQRLQRIKDELDNARALLRAARRRRERALRPAT